MVPSDPYSAGLTIELRTLSGAESVPEAEGVVLLPDGGPARGATVRYGFDWTETDEDGRFYLPLDSDPAPDLQLAAGLEGYGTEIVERYGENSDKVPKALTDYIKDRADYDYAHHGRAGNPSTDFVPDEIVDRFCVLGRVDDHIAKLTKLLALGVDGLVTDFPGRLAGVVSARRAGS